MLLKEATPPTANVEPTTAVPVTDKSCLTVAFPPTTKLRAIPAPPAVIKEPLVVDVEFVVVLNASAPAFISVDPSVLKNVTLVPVAESLTRSIYNEFPLIYKSAKGFDSDPKLTPDPTGIIEPAGDIVPLTDSELINMVSPNTVAVVPTIKFLAIAAPPAACKAFD